MNTNASSTGQSDHESDQQKDWLRALIENCADLPKLVREAEFARIDERMLDDSLFQFLSENRAGDARDQATSIRVQRRIQALTPYVGQSLICVSIRLPGVGYTIEVDPVDKCIVHWEWLAA